VQAAAARGARGLCGASGSVVVLVVAALVGGAVLSGYGRFELDQFSSRLTDTNLSGLRIELGKSGPSPTPDRRAPSLLRTFDEPTDEPLAAADDASAAHLPQVWPTSRVCIVVSLSIYIYVGTLWHAQPQTYIHAHTCRHTRTHAYAQRGHGDVCVCLSSCVRGVCVCACKYQWLYVLLCMHDSFVAPAAADADDGRACCRIFAARVAARGECRDRSQEGRFGR
jgi:hypothetical protein